MEPRLGLATQVLGQLESKESVLSIAVRDESDETVAQCFAIGSPDDFAIRVDGEVADFLCVTILKRGCPYYRLTHRRGD